MFATQANAYKMAEEFARMKKKQERSKSKGAPPAAGGPPSASGLSSDEFSISTKGSFSKQTKGSGGAWDDENFPPSWTERCRIQATDYVLQYIEQHEKVLECKERVVDTDKQLVKARSEAGCKIGEFESLLCCFSEGRKGAA